MPLYYSYVLTPIQETIEELLAGGQAPVYVVHFTQESAIERAQALMSINVCTRAEKDRIAELIGDFRFTAGFGRTLSRLVRHGIGVHHAGMLPKYRRLVETLAQAGLLKVICGTDTLGVGINVPIRTVLLTGLSKYDGTKVRHLKVREFHQIAGRAGRAGYDDRGWRGRAGARARHREREGARQGRRRPAQASPGRAQEAAGGLRVVGRADLRPARRLGPGDPDVAVQRHALDGPQRDRAPGRPGRRRCAACSPRTTTTRRRSAATSGAPSPSTAPCSPGASSSASTSPRRTAAPSGSPIDLPDNFALNQPLSPFALGALELLDRESPTYALDVVSVVESILDDPRQVLHAQRHKARGEAVAAMKAEGLEYDERMDLLQDVTHPQPLAELLEAAYAIYQQGPSLGRRLRAASRSPSSATCSSAP